MMPHVRTLVRYLLFFGVLVALAFAVVSVEIGGETLYRRYQIHRLWPKASSWVESWRPKLAKTKRPVTVKPKAKQPDRARERVAILRRATQAASPEMRTAPPKRRTSVDSPASPEQKKALDELLSSRVTRR
jgi:hypothetical protein